MRSFLLGWIQVLDSVPDIDLLKDLPEFLDGIFTMLADKKKDIHCNAESILAEFLNEIQQNSTQVKFGSLVKILIPHCSSTGTSLFPFPFPFLLPFLFYPSPFSPFSAFSPFPPSPSLISSLSQPFPFQSPLSLNPHSPRVLQSITFLPCEICPCLSLGRRERQEKSIHIFHRSLFS